MRRLGGLLLAVGALLAAGCGLPVGQSFGPAEHLPVIGPAPDFSLTAQDETRLSLGALRGRVVALAFIYTSCTDSCPLVTAKMSGLQSKLGADFGPRVFFTSITVDPARDTPRVLAAYAGTFHADLSGWAFLTGSVGEIEDVEQRYGVFARRTARGDVDHTLLTSLIDQRGALRVQYLGYRFDPAELLRDLESLLREA
jgi:protein SCO1/2